MPWEFLMTDKFLTFHIRFIHGFTGLAIEEGRLWPLVSAHLPLEPALLPRVGWLRAEGARPRTYVRGTSPRL